MQIIKKNLNTNMRDAHVNSKKINIMPYSDFMVEKLYD